MTKVHPCGPRRSAFRPSVGAKMGTLPADSRKGHGEIGHNISDRVRTSARAILRREVGLQPSTLSW
jgi:hypothetical protein